MADKIVVKTRREKTQVQYLRNSLLGKIAMARIHIKCVKNSYTSVDEEKECAEGILMYIDRLENILRNNKGVNSVIEIKKDE